MTEQYLKHIEKYLCSKCNGKGVYITHGEWWSQSQSCDICKGNGTLQPNMACWIPVLIEEIYKLRSEIDKR